MQNTTLGTKWTLNKIHSVVASCVFRLHQQVVSRLNDNDLQLAVYRLRC